MTLRTSESVETTPLNSPIDPPPPYWTLPAYSTQPTQPWPETLPHHLELEPLVSKPSMEDSTTTLIIAKEKQHCRRNSIEMVYIGDGFGVLPFVCVEALPNGATEDVVGSGANVGIHDPEVGVADVVIAGRGGHFSDDCCVGFGVNACCEHVSCGKGCGGKGCCSGGCCGDGCCGDGCCGDGCCGDGCCGDGCCGDGCCGDGCPVECVNPICRGDSCDCGNCVSCLSCDCDNCDCSGDCDCGGCDFGGCDCGGCDCGGCAIS